ncbi:hypothetical protein Tco_0563344 [Tanacetum coccineum]
MTGVTGDKHLCSGTVSSDQKKKVQGCSDVRVDVPLLIAGLLSYLTAAMRIYPSFYSGTPASLGICLDDVTTMAHSAGINIVIRIVTTPPPIGNLSIQWAVDGTARISRIPGLPIMPLYGDNDLTIMKFIQAFVE